MFAAVRTARVGASTMTRQLHHSRVVRAVTEFKLPAMSPTMTEGSIGEWKVKEGQAFAGGDVIMTVETDKATVDVEAQDDGILAKIGVAAGTAGIPVGQTIALLAEEGDDISNLEFPTESASSSSSSSSPSPTEASSPAPAESDAPTPSPATPTPYASSVHAHPTHSKPLLPSVLRQLALAGITDTSEIEATGHAGRLTKGDVLAFLGKISSPYGSIKKENLHGKHPALEYAASPKDTKPQVTVQLDGPAIRRIIASGLGIPPTSARPSSEPAFATPAPISFDSILEDYVPRRQAPRPASPTPPTPPPSTSKNAFDAFLDL
ncbi:hypothetical protein JCM10212_000150 [Sporobolomyces blumeae]